MPALNGRQSIRIFFSHRSRNIRGARGAVNGFEWRRAEIRLKNHCNALGRPYFHASSNKRDLNDIMADLANKYSDNVTGTFYVDDQCIDCDLCRETAPANFTRNDDGGHSYVYKQPENDAETALCKEAMEGCPVEAIGDNGG